MKTLAEKIAVMQAAGEGKPIERSIRGGSWAGSLLTLSKPSPIN